MKVAIVEDEAQVGKRVERLVRAAIGDRLESVAQFTSLETARSFLTSGQIDLLFLDLNLNGEDGFELLESVVAESFSTIIISAYKDQACRAYEYGVLDFVPKPISEARLLQALDRLHSVPAVPEATSRRLAIKSNGLVEFVPIDEIIYVSGADDYSEVALRTGRKRLSDKSLTSLGALVGHAFVRVHRSRLVRVSEITNLHVREGSRYSVELRNGHRLPVGRHRVTELRRRLST